MKKLKIGTRGSALALWQAEFVKESIGEHFSGIDIEIIKIKTTGDRVLDRDLAEIGGKGVFVKEIEESLIKKEIDIAVHSLKDLPVILPEKLTLGAFMKRHNPCDVLISRDNIKLADHKKGDRVGTGSIRRKAQILCLYPHLDVIPVRGNVDTRIKKLKTEGFASVILAGAGVERLGLFDRVSEVFATNTIIPAPGQGIVAVECRKDDEDIFELLKTINDSDSGTSATLERSFLRTLGGDCSVPAGCYSEVCGDKIRAEGIVIAPDGSSLVRDKVLGSATECLEIGSELARMLLESGGSKILSDLQKV